MNPYLWLSEASDEYNPSHYAGKTSKCLPATDVVEHPGAAVDSTPDMVELDWLHWPMDVLPSMETGELMTSQELAALLVDHDASEASASSSLDTDWTTKSNNDPAVQGDNIHYNIQSLQAFRVNGVEVEILVNYSNFKGGLQSWMPEAIVQDHVPNKLVSFWRRVGRYVSHQSSQQCNCIHVCSGRCALTGQGKRRVFKISDHKWTPEGYGYKVWWVGYTKKEFTWEAEPELREKASAILEEYRRERNLGPA